MNYYITKPLILSLCESIEDMIKILGELSANRGLGDIDRSSDSARDHETQYL